VLEEVANKGGIDMAVRFNEQVYLSLIPLFTD